MESLLLFLEVL